MSELTTGSVCTGYGGLDGVLAAVLGARTIWVADNDPDVSKLLKLRFGDVPNLGDVQAADWQHVERPHIMCMGFPCQDISPAGKRQGIRPGTKSGLWTWLAYVIGVVEPSYVFIENSRGLTSAKAHSDVEQCAFCMGDGSSKPALRALGRVVGDLADLGYDAEWRCVRASDVGAPHERHRAFIWAWRRDVDPDPRRGLGQARRGSDSAEQGPLSSGRAAFSSGDAERRRSSVDADARCGSVRGPAGDQAGATGSNSSSVPVGVGDGGQRVRVDDRNARARLAADAERVQRRPRGEPRSGQTPGGRASSESRGCDRTGNAAGRHDDAADAVGSELPRERDEQPRRVAVAGARCAVADARSSRLEVGHAPGAAADTDRVGRPSWRRVALRGQVRRIAPRGPYDGDAPEGFVWRVGDRDYTAAIRTWETITGRRAPIPAVPNRRGDFRLNPRLSEWMMGLPDGWVTAVPGLSRTAMLRIIGNGLLPAQGALALLLLLDQSGDS